MKSLRCALVLLFATACGSPGAEFVGTYKTNGTFALTLNGQSQTQPMTDALSISEGTDSDIVITWDDCFYQANVEDNTATVRNGVSCTRDMMVDGQAVTATVTITTGTLSRAGSVVTLNFSGPLSIIYDGRTYPGTYTTTATLNRVTK